MAFYQKYRSKTFGELVGQDHIAGTLSESIKNGTSVHAYLLTGPRGIGKTSTARLLAKAINCEKIRETKSGEPCNECSSCRDINEGRSLDVIEIDAASHTGVDEIRELIDKARLSPTKSLKKVYIIDEVHMLSKSAFNALLKTLEEPPSHVVFIMATTEAHKVPATIISRVQRFDFKRASKADIITNLQRVAEAESIKIDSQSLDLIAVAAAGGHRDALGLLEQVAASGGEISIETTRKILGIPKDDEVWLFVGAIFNKNPEEGLKIARRLYEGGTDLGEFCKKVIESLRKVMVYLAAGNIQDNTEETEEKIKALAAEVGLSRLVSIIAIFIEASQLLKDVNYPLLPLELALIKSVQSDTTSADVVHERDVKKAGDIARVTLKTASSQSAAEPSRETAKVPVPVMEMTKDIWHQVIELTKKDNSTLAALLRDAHPEGLSDDTMTIGVKFKFHKDRISEPKNSDALEKVIAKVMGSSYKIHCKISNPKEKTLIGGQNNNLEEAVSEVFEL